MLLLSFMLLLSQIEAWRYFCVDQDSSSTLKLKVEVGF